MMNTTEVLSDLACKVRVMTDAQLRADARSSPLPWIRDHVRKGNIVSKTVMLPAPVVRKTPLLDWSVGDAPPNFDRLAWNLSSRRNHPAGST